MAHETRIRLIVAAAACLCACALAAPAQAYVYWTNEGPGNATDGTTVGRANLDASGLTHSFITGGSAPSGILVYGTHIYWANTQTNAIGRANIDGRSPNQSFIPNATSGSASALPTGIATDGTHLYWTDGDRYVGRANLDGTFPQQHFIDAGSSSFPSGIGVAGGTIYLSEFGGIVHVPVTGGSPQLLALLPGSTITTALAVAGGYVYVAGINTAMPAPDGSIIRVQENGSGLDAGFVPNLSLPTGVAVDGSHVYWADHGDDAIGRAQLGTTGSTDVRPDFVGEPGGPGGVAVDSNVDPTVPALSCAPASVVAGNPTSCHVTIGDTASSARPTGPVVFSSNASTFFSGSSSSCTLASPFGATAGCTIGAIPLNAGNTQIVAAYAGDAVHHPSQATLTICVGATAPCSAPPHVRCTVPRLKGKTLKRAKVLLTRAHCKLGKVKRPKNGHKLVVSRQTPKGGSIRAAGSKVALTLAPKRH